MGGETLIVRGGRVIDPANDVDGVLDVAIRAGRVAGVGRSPAAVAGRVVDAAGCYVIPGAIDTEVHVPAGPYGEAAFAMLARAGVTTALDLAGPIEAVLANARDHGAGLAVGCLDRFVPGTNVSRPNPSRAEIGRVVDAALAAGALGVKLHVDDALTPEATATAIEEANRRRAYVAQHCGTTATASDLTGLRETIDLAGPHRLQIAHVNSYCRGDVDDPVVEAQEAVRLLRRAPRLFSESYLAAINGSWGECRDGVVLATRARATWLPAGGYPGTATGLRQAIRDGYTQVPVPRGDDVALVSGDEGVAAWEAAATAIGVAFPVNPASSRLLLAASKDATGRFDVDALATDGGGTPRNNLIAAGLGLVEFGALTLQEWICKIAWTPARVLGLPGKGHLGEGADADLVVVDPVRRRARTTIAAGTVVMHAGVVLGRGTRILTTAAGEGAVRRSGCDPLVVDLAASGFYTGDGLKA